MYLSLTNHLSQFKGKTIQAQVSSQINERLILTEISGLAEILGVSLKFSSLLTEILGLA